MSQAQAQIATQETTIINLTDLLAMKAEAVLRAAELQKQIAVAKKQEKEEAKQAERQRIDQEAADQFAEGSNFVAAIMQEIRTRIEHTNPQVKALLRTELKAMVNELVPQKEQATGTKVAAKYQDAFGNTRTGRGLKPKWLTAALEAGASLADFAIPAPEQTTA